jgi:hypothetical protein
MVHRYRPNFPRGLSTDGSRDPIRIACCEAVACGDIAAAFARDETNRRSGPGGSTSQFPSFLRTSAGLSLRRRIQAAASWAAKFWRASAAYPSGKRTIRDERQHGSLASLKFDEEQTQILTPKR